MLHATVVNFAVFHICRCKIIKNGRLLEVHKPSLIGFEAFQCIDGDDICCFKNLDQDYLNIFFGQGY